MSTDSGSVFVRLSVLAISQWRLSLFLGICMIVSEADAIAMDALLKLVFRSYGFSFTKYGYTQPQISRVHSSINFRTTLLCAMLSVEPYIRIFLSFIQNMVT